MKSDFLFSDSGFDYKAEFEGIFKKNGKDHNCFHFFKKIGSSWQHIDCKSFPSRATKKDIVADFLESA